MKIKLNELKVLVKRIINEELSNEIPIKQIMSGYIEAALWTEEERLTDKAESMYSGYDDEEDEEETELDKLVKITAQFNRKSFSSFEKEHIDTDSIMNAYDDIQLFLSKIPKEILQIAFKEQSPESFGHDIWFTRNGHGAGFWDGDYSYEVEEVIMEAIKVLRKVDLVLGDDMKLYFE
jgi:hypothetical protein